MTHLSRKLVLASAAALIASLFAVAPLGAQTLCNGEVPTIQSNEAVITGTPERDVILAGSGDNNIRALGGDDVICAGSGNDTVAGNAGADVIFGEDGNDVIRGGPGADDIFGGSGDDELRLSLIHI